MKRGLRIRHSRLNSSGPRRNVTEETVTKTDFEITRDLAFAVQEMLMVMTKGYNTMPRDRMARDAVEEGMAALATFEARYNKDAA